jgi:hypothetical protein
MTIILELNQYMIFIYVLLQSPCSGMAMIGSNSNNVYSEVDGMQLLLKYEVMNAGCCKILLVRNFAHFNQTPGLLVLVKHAVFSFLLAVHCFRPLLSYHLH